MGERRIKCLELTVPSRSAPADQCAMQLALLEDAFATASLPGLPPNAHVAIRYLDLGSIAPGASPAALALTISERIRLLAGNVVCVDRQDAPRAPAVWFSDIAHAHARILNKTASGDWFTEWYWPSLTVVEAPDAMVRRSLLALAVASPDGVAQARVLHALVTSSRIDSVLRRVDRATGSMMVDAIGELPSTLDPAALSTVTAISRSPGAQDWLATVARWTRVWDTGDPRTHWLARQMVLAVRPDLGGSDLCARLASEIVSRAGDSTMHRSPAFERLDHRASRPTRSLGAQTRAAFPGVELIDVSTSSGPPAAHDPSPRPWDPVTGAAEPRQRPLSTNSRHAGLALLIPVFQHLGMTRLLKEHAALLIGGLPQRALEQVADRFGVPEGDPVRALAYLEARPRVEPLERFEAPRIWHSLTRAPGLREDVRVLSVAGTDRVVVLDKRHRIPLRAAPRHEVDEKDLRRCVRKRESDLRFEEILEGLLSVVSRFIRRSARIGLRTLIQRPAEIIATHTHFDVLFDDDIVDIRIRRAGLDIDPGWVHWLGRVVQYHYVTGVERARFGEQWAQ